MIPWWVAALAFFAGAFVGTWLLAIVNFTHNRDE